MFFHGVGPMLEVDMGEGSFFMMSEFGLGRISISLVLFSLGKKGWGSLVCSGHSWKQGKGNSF